MTTGTSGSILIIAVVALCTFFTRVFPFLLFGGKKEVPAMVRYLGDMLPPAIIAVLIVYCVRNVEFLAFPHGLPEWIAIGLTLALHLWKRNNLLSIGGGTICYMLLVQFVFV